jgi:hypothetical protein
MTKIGVFVRWQQMAVLFLSKWGIHRTQLMFLMCVCICVPARAASNSGPSTEHYSNNKMRLLLDSHFTWCWIGRNRPIACPLCFTGLTPWNFSFGAVWNVLCAPNLLLIIRTCVTDSQCYFDYETRYFWTYSCLVGCQFDMVRAARSVHAGANYKEPLTIQVCVRQQSE